MHRQIYISVNASVDSKIANLVMALSKFRHLETVDSCQGIGDMLAYVIFCCGSWREITDLIFRKLSPALYARLDGVVIFILTTNGHGYPLAEMRMPTRLIDDVTAVIDGLSP